MPAAYDMDLRHKAVAAVDRGEKKSQVSRMFNISRDTLDRWLKQRESTGSIAPKHCVKRGPDPTIKDIEAFRRFAKANGHLTQHQMADLWPDQVSNRTICTMLKRIGFTRKKDLWVPRA